MYPHRTLMLAAVVSLLLAGFASAGDFNHKNVEALTASNFKDKVSDGSVYFIKFYAPWCGHCKRLGPTWGELGDAFAGHSVVKIATVDCTVHKSVCSDAGVKGYPTLKVFANGEEFATHRGPRELAALKTFVEDSAKDLTTETTD